MRHMCLLVRHMYLLERQVEFLCASGLSGPDVVHCEGIVKEAIKEGEGGGHFIRCSQNIKTHQVSKAVDTLVAKPLNVPFMA